MKHLIVIAAMALVFPAGVALGQKGGSDDGPVGIFSTGQEYDQFMGSAKELAYGPDGSPELRAMIPMLNDIALNRPIGWTNQKYGGPGGTLDLLSDQKVRQELEMMDDQYEELQRMNEEVQKRAGEQLRGLDFNDRDSLVRQIRKIREQAEKDLNSVLLPHQLDRLKQLRAQSRLRNRSFIDVITSEPLKSELEISDEQSGELKQAEQEIEEELAREIAELREKARTRLLSKLKKSQREEVEEIFGDMFDFANSAGKRDKRKRRK